MTDEETVNSYLAAPETTPEYPEIDLRSPQEVQLDLAKPRVETPGPAEDGELPPLRVGNLQIQQPDSASGLQFAGSDSDLVDNYLSSTDEDAKKQRLSTIDNLLETYTKGTWTPDDDYLHSLAKEATEAVSPIEEMKQAAEGIRGNFYQIPLPGGLKLDTGIPKISKVAQGLWGFIKPALGYAKEYYESGGQTGGAEAYGAARGLGSLMPFTLSVLSASPYADPEQRAQNMVKILKTQRGVNEAADWVAQELGYTPGSMPATEETLENIGSAAPFLAGGETLAPLAGPIRSATQKVAQKAVEDVIPGVVGGAIRTAAPLARVAPVAAEFVSGKIPFIGKPIGTLVNGILDAPLKSIDQFGKMLTNLPEGQTVFNATKQRLTEDIAASQKEEEILKSAAGDKINTTKIYNQQPNGQFSVQFNNLNTQEKQIRQNLMDRMALQKKIDVLDGWNKVAILAKDAAKTGIAGGLQIGVGGATLGALNAAQALPGETQQAAQEGTLAGFALTSPALLPTALDTVAASRMGRIKQQGDYLQRLAKTNGWGDDPQAANLSDDLQRQVDIHNGAMAGGGKMVVLDPQDLKTRLGLSPNAEAPNGQYDPNTNTAYLNSDVLNKYQSLAAARHELGHYIDQVTGGTISKAYSTFLDDIKSPSPAIAAQRQAYMDEFLNAYMDAAHKSDPAMQDISDEELMKEGAAELGRYVLERTPIEEVFAGQSPYDWIGRKIQDATSALKGDPGEIFRIPTFKTPFTRTQLNAVSDAIFDYARGIQKGTISPKIPDISVPDIQRGPTPIVAPEVPGAAEAGVTPPIPVNFKLADDAVSAMRSLGIPAAAARDRVLAALDDVHKAGEEVNLDNIMRRALPRNVPAEMEPNTEGQLNLPIIEQMGPRGVIKRYQLMPSSEPEAVKAKALMYPDGKIFTGPMHANANTDAFEWYKNNGQLNQFHKWFTADRQNPGEIIKQGFVNNQGDFLDRAQAHETMQRLGQLSQLMPASPIIGEALRTRNGFLVSADRLDEAKKLGMDITGAQQGYITKKGQFVPADMVDKQTMTYDPEELYNREDSWMPATPNSPEFKKWFEGSKVVDENGRPLLVFHGSKKDFDTFDPTRGNSIGFHFGTLDQATDRLAMRALTHSEENLGSALYPVYLSMKNPLYLPEDMGFNAAQPLADKLREYGKISKGDYFKWREMWNKEFGEKLHNRAASVTEIQAQNNLMMKFLKDLGYDGYIYPNQYEGRLQQGVLPGGSPHYGNAYAVFDPSQVKSALANQTWGIGEPRMQFMPSAPVDSPQFQNWFKDSKVVDNSGKPLVVFHGTASPIDAFSQSLKGTSTHYPDSQLGFFFTENPEEAAYFAHYAAGAQPIMEQGEITFDTAVGQNILPVFLSLQNPKILAQDDYIDLFHTPDILLRGLKLKWLREGHDGLMYNVPNGYSFIEGSEGRNDVPPSRVFVAFKPEQVKSALANTGEYNPRSPHLSMMPTTSDLGFYSGLEKAAEEKLPNRASAPQILATLRKAGGVKENEIKWVLGDFLERNPNPTKQELLDYIRANQVQVQEVQQGKGDVLSPYEKEELSQLQAQYHQDPDSFIDSDYQRLQSLEEKAGMPGAFNFPSLNLQGYTPGTYRELLLTIPNQISDDDFRAAYQKQTGVDVTDKKKWPDITRLRQQMAALMNLEFQSSHFSEPNIIAHMRIAEYKTPDGEPILVSNEFQSDWAKELRGHVRNLPLENLGNDVYRKGDYMIVPVYNPEIKNLRDAGFHKAADTLKNAQEENLKWKIKPPGNAPFESAVYDSPHKAEAEINQRGSPDMPFRSTDAWTSLLLKRLIGYAVDHGYHKIGWTTGEQQVERYGLSKQINNITATRNEDGTYFIRAEDTEGNQHGLGGNIPENKLADYVGKDLAEQIAQQKKSTDSYYGQDLKIGYKGMTGYYDNIVPKVANQIGKQFGTKVSTGEIQVQNPVKLPNMYVVDLRNGQPDPWVVKNDVGQYLASVEGTQWHDTSSRALRFNNSKSADQAIDQAGAVYQKRGETTEPIHVLEIPPSMSETVKTQGQSLFMPTTVNIGLDRADGKFNTPETTITALKAAGLKPINHEVYGNTLVATLQSHPSEEQANQISKDLHQEAIAVNTGNHGSLMGPQKEKWEPFNPDLFKLLSGQSLSESHTGARGISFMPRTWDQISAYLTPEELGSFQDNYRKKIVAAFKKLDPERGVQYALAGKQGKGWYKNAVNAIHALLASDNPEFASDPDRFAGLAAALSPNRPVDAALTHALQAWNEWEKRGRPIDRNAIELILHDANVIYPEDSPDGEQLAGGQIKSMVNNTLRVLSAYDPSMVQLSGQKVNPFFANLRGDVNRVTNDRHMAMYGYGQPQLSDRSIYPGGQRMKIAGAQGLALTAHIRQIAQRLSEISGETWTPAEVQAAIWTYQLPLQDVADAMGVSTKKLLAGGYKLSETELQKVPSFSFLMQHSRNQPAIQSIQTRRAIPEVQHVPEIPF